MKIIRYANTFFYFFTCKLLLRLVGKVAYTVDTRDRELLFIELTQGSGGQIIAECAVASREKLIFYIVKLDARKS